MYNSEKVGLKRDTSFSGVASSGRFKLAWDASILSALQLFMMEIRVHEDRFA